MMSCTTTGHRITVITKVLWHGTTALTIDEGTRSDLTKIGLGLGLGVRATASGGRITWGK